MIHRLWSGCCWGISLPNVSGKDEQHFSFLYWRSVVLLLDLSQELLSRCPRGFRVLWMYDAHLSGERWVFQFDSGQSYQLFPVDIAPLSLPAPLAPGWQLWSILGRYVCMGQWVSRGRKRDMTGDNGSTWSHMFPYLFSFYIWTLTLETQKPRMWLVLSWYCHDNSLMWQTMSSLAV